MSKQETEFDKVKRDYQKLIEKWGYPYDMTGGFVDAEQMEKVILNPTKQKAANYMKDVICYGFQGGEYYESEQHGKVDINRCDLLSELYDKYIR